MELWVQDLDRSPTNIVLSDFKLVQHLFELARWNAQNGKQDAVPIIKEVVSEASWMPFE